MLEDSSLAYRGDSTNCIRDHNFLLRHDFTFVAQRILRADISPCDHLLSIKVARCDEINLTIDEAVINLETDNAWICKTVRRSRLAASLFVMYRLQFRRSILSLISRSPHDCSRNPRACRGGRQVLISPLNCWTCFPEDKRAYWVRHRARLRPDG